MKIHRLKLSFSNVYLVQGEKTILVDSGMPGEGKQILNAARKIGVKPGDISLILHTHAHVDHAGSSAELKRILGIPTAVHVADADQLRRGRMNPLTPMRLEARLIKPVVDRPFPALEPDLLIDEATDLSRFGIQGAIFHTPGHTAGSISLFFPNREAIIGDLLMGGYMGGNLLSSQPKYHYFAEDLRAVRASIRKVIALQPARLFVGHGGPLDPHTVVNKFSREIEFQT